MNRRAFLQRTSRAGAACAVLGAAAGVAPAIEPFQRTGPARLLLSCAAYSFRDFFVKPNAQPAANAAPKKTLDLFQFVDLCFENGCAGTELTSYYFPPNVTDQFLAKLRRHCFLRGVAVSGTSVGNTFTLPPGPERAKQVALVKTWIDHAAVLGAPHIRIFAGGAGKLSRGDAVKYALECIEECCEYAGQKGIFLGLENHGGIVAQPSELLELVKAVKSPWFGVNLDTGNFNTEDPYRDLAECAPYAVNVQIKADLRRKGAKTSEPADLPRLAKLLRDAGYQGYVALEYESAESPWTAVPRLLQQMKTALGA